jgi:uncharacterized protein YdiU (UPF0061 family)
MNDFLKKMRNPNDRNYDRQRRQYINPQFMNNQKQSKENRKPPHRRNKEADQTTKLINEILPIIRSNIEDIADTQRQLAEQAERRTKAEERKADAMERIAVFIENQMSGDFFQPLKSNEKTEPKPSVETSTKPAVKEKKAAAIPVSENSERQKVIRTIKKMRDQGSTYSQIARHLEDKNIATFSGKGKWHPQTVQKIYQS